MVSSCACPSWGQGLDLQPFDPQANTLTTEPLWPGQGALFKDKRTDYYEFLVHGLALDGGRAGA